MNLTGAVQDIPMDNDDEKPQSYPYLSNPVPYIGPGLGVSLDVRNEASAIVSICYFKY